MTILSVTALADTYDLVIVGAGPAGLSAATVAAGHPLSVLLIDENASVGGQIYRAITTTPTQNKTVLGQDYWRGATLANQFLQSAVTYLPQAVVWSVRSLNGRSEITKSTRQPRESGDDGNGAAIHQQPLSDPSPGFEIGISAGGISRLIRTNQCILATGALERPFPVPGWTLPGVMTVGAAQTLLKESGIIPDGNIVLAGCGPLLYVLAQEIATAGGRLLAVLDTTPAANWRRALSALPAFLSSPYATKGVKLLLSARWNTRIISNVTDIALKGTEKAVDHIRFRRRGGVTERLSADVVLLHQGVIPDINLSSAAGCAHDWNPRQLCWSPRVDETFQSTVHNLAIAGDGSGIGGADSSVIAGEIAAIGAIHRLGRIEPNAYRHQLAEKRRAWKRQMRGRQFIDRLYTPGKQFRIPEDPATIVCRCEEITAGRIRQTVADGCSGPNQLKAFLRCGMGACQGRLCGVTVSELISDIKGSTPGDVGHFHLRPPVKPITLAELAALRK